MSGRILAALAAVAVSATAHADRVAMEAYVGNRPADAERVLAPIRSLLEQHGFVADPVALTKHFEAHVWRSGGARTAGPAILKKIEDGIREFEDAKLNAADTLKAAIGLARANPVAWVNEPKYRDEVRRGVLVLALALNLRAKEARDQSSRVKGKRQSDISQRATADEQARDETMDDLLRNFPSFVVKADEFGSQAEALFLEASKRAHQNSGGSIELDVDDPNVIVYVDEAQQPRKTTIGNVIAGRHRVLVVSASESREYALDVLPNRRSRIAVRWDLDTVLRIGSWVGFAFSSERERQREPELLASLIGRSGSIDAVVSLTVNPDASAVAGQSYDMRNGKPFASCSLADPRHAAPDAVARFVTCLTDQKEVDQTPPPHLAAATTSGVDAGKRHVDDKVDDRRDVSGVTSRRWTLWASVGSFGVAAVSGVLAGKFAFDGRAASRDYDRACADRCTSQQAKSIIADHDVANRRAWVATGVAGGAVVAGAVLLVLWHGSDSSTTRLIAQITDGGAILGWSAGF